LYIIKLKITLKTEKSLEISYLRTLALYILVQYSSESKEKIAKEEFLEFMKTNLPDIQISPVFDLVSLNYLQWQYLGSFAIDTDIDTPAYKLLAQKYGNPYDDATVNNKVLWIIEYDFAKKHHEERMETII